MAKGDPGEPQLTDSDEMIGLLSIILIGAIDVCQSGELTAPSRSEVWTLATKVPYV